MADAYNLDDGITEYFEFILLGHTYRFKYLSTAEVKKMQDVPDNDESIKALLYNFITPVGDAPPFDTIADDLTMAHWKAFRNMLNKEMGLTDGKDNSSPKAT